MRWVWVWCGFEEGGGVLTDIDLQVMLQEAAKALQDAPLQVCIHLLLEQLLHNGRQLDNSPGFLFIIYRCDSKKYVSSRCRQADWGGGGGS